MGVGQHLSHPGQHNGGMKDALLVHRGEPGAGGWQGPPATSSRSATIFAGRGPAGPRRGWGLDTPRRSGPKSEHENEVEQDQIGPTKSNEFQRNPTKSKQEIRRQKTEEKETSNIQCPSKDTRNRWRSLRRPAGTPLRANKF